MVLNLDYLDQITARRASADHQPLFLQQFLVIIVKFIAVAMALGYVILTIGLVSKGIFFQTAGVGPQSHGGAFIRILISSLGAAGFFIKPLQHQVNDRIGRELVKF